MYNIEIHTANKKDDFEIKRLRALLGDSIKW